MNPARFVENVQLLEWPYLQNKALMKADFYTFNLKCYLVSNEYKTSGNNNTWSIYRLYTTNCLTGTSETQFWNYLLVGHPEILL